MTRKRFVKLVMSCGHDRNYANARAVCCISLYGSYREAWKSSYDLRFIHAFKVLANAITPAFKHLWQQCKGTLKSIGPIITPLGSAGLDWSENYDGSFAGGSPEVDKANPCGNEERRDQEEQAEYGGIVSR